MKKNIYIVLFGLLLSLGVASCDNDTDLLFDETASQRKEGAVEEYNDALKSSEQGWLFQYFPEETQMYGGYNYVVKFNQHDSVTVWYEGMTDFTKPETSLYDLISYGGPVLTFNTYNSLMHEFANPSASEYLAKGGDFEFLIISDENDVITLKGIKTGNMLRMTKMTEAPEVYLQKINVISQLFKSSSLEGTIKGAEVGISLNDHRLVFNYIENDEIKSEKAAFIPTPTGISFYEPLTILGVTVQNLAFNVETNQLVSTNDEIIIDIIKAPIDLTLARWTIFTAYESECSAAFKAVWDEVNIANDAIWGYTLSPNLDLGRPSDRGIGLRVLFGNYPAIYNLKFGGVLDQPDYIKIEKEGAGFQWNYTPHFMPLVDIITNNSPYIIEMDNADDPSIIKLTSVNNPDVWFVLRK